MSGKKYDTISGKSLYGWQYTEDEKEEMYEKRKTTKKEIQGEALNLRFLRYAELRMRDLLLASPVSMVAALIKETRNTFHAFLT